MAAAWMNDETRDRGCVAAAWMNDEQCCRCVTDCCVAAWPRLGEAAKYNSRCRTYFDALPHPTWSRNALPHPANVHLNDRAFFTSAQHRETHPELSRVAALSVVALLSAPRVGPAQRLLVMRATALSLRMERPVLRLALHAPHCDPSATVALPRHGCACHFGIRHWDFGGRRVVLKGSAQIPDCILGHLEPHF